MSYAIDEYATSGTGFFIHTAGTPFAGAASNGLVVHLVTLSGFSGVDANGFDRTRMNGTFGVISSSSNQINFQLYLVGVPGINNTVSLSPTQAVNVTDIGLPGTSPLPPFATIIGKPHDGREIEYTYKGLTWCKGMQFLTVGFFPKSLATPYGGQIWPRANATLVNGGQYPL
jgi:hypothetical protein